MTTAYILRRRKLGRGSTAAIAALSQTGITVVRNWRDNIPIQPDLCIRWGCTTNVPQRNVLNKSEAIHRVADKAEFRKTLNTQSLCPLTVFTIRELVYPCVIRPKVHSRGRHVYLCRNEQDAQAAVAACGEGWYGSMFIDKVAEYRVFCMSGRALAVAQKTPGNPEDVAWNVAQGGRFDNVRWDEWNLRAVRKSLEAFALSGLDFGGVDVMVDQQGECFILEINSAPSLTSPYRQEAFAKGLDYIVRNGKDFIPLTNARGGWRKFIHPAISTDAIIGD